MLVYLVNYNENTVTYIFYFILEFIYWNLTYAYVNLLYHILTLILCLKFPYYIAIFA